MAQGDGEGWNEELALTWKRRGRHISYQRGKRITTPGTSLIQIEGVSDTKGAKYVEQSTRQTGKY